MEYDIDACLWVGYGGASATDAVADLLAGNAVPSGRLTDTWVYDVSSAPSGQNMGDCTFQQGSGLPTDDGSYQYRSVSNKYVVYLEGIYVGYRYYDKAEKAVRYPFGYGLSYTTFTYSDMRADSSTVSVKITNTGTVKGSEIAQLYIAPPKDGLFRPEKELKGFDRVELEPGESKTIEFALDDRSFAVWDDGWKIPGGTYGILIGSSSKDIRLKAEIEVSGVSFRAPSWQAGSWYETLKGEPDRAEWEKLMGHPVAVLPEAKKGSFTMDNSCMEMKDSSLIMKIQYKVTENIIAKDFGGKKDLSDPAYRMTLICATDCPLRSVIISGGRAMTDRLAAGLLHMANGHYLKGIAALFKK